MKNNGKILILILLLIAMSTLSGCDNGIEEKEYLINYDEDNKTFLKSASDSLPGADDNCVLYYKFNEGSGGTVHDETGKHPGVIINGSKDCWTESLYGNALNFKTNNNQYIYVDDAPDLSPTSITIEMIVKFDSSAKYIAYQKLLFKDFAYNVSLETAGTPVINFNLYTETNTAWLTAKVRLNGEVFDGEYHHIAFTYDGITGLTRAYFDYWCEDAIYLSPGIIMPHDKNYPLYVGAGYWADSIQEVSTVTFDSLKISSDDLYANEFLDSPTSSDNYLDSLKSEETFGTKEYDISLNSSNQGQILNSDNEVLGTVNGNVEYTLDGLYTQQNASEASFDIDEGKFTSGYLGVEVVVKLDENDIPDKYDQKDGTILYKENDFMICTYVYDAGNNTVGYIVTFRVKIAEADLISVENQMCVNYNIYDGKPHHLALNYNPITATMDGYIDYKKVVTKSFADIASSGFNFEMTDSPIYIGKSINNWHGNGWYSKINLYDGIVATKDMYGYKENSNEDYKESGELVCDVRFNERVGTKYSLDFSAHENNAFLLEGTSLYKDNGEGVLNIAKEGENAAVIYDSKSLNSNSVSLVINFKLNDGYSYGLHRLVFKDFQYDLCLDIKSNGVNVTTKLNTKKDGWLTRASGVANELLDGQYHEIIMTYNSNSGCVSIYLDQKLIASEIWGGELVGKNQDIYLGSGYWNNSLNQGCTCSINDVKIYNYAITMGE